jgi:ankyrin repeat protein
MIAVQNVHRDIVEYLLEHGADVNISKRDEVLHLPMREPFTLQQRPETKTSFSC